MLLNEGEYFLTHQLRDGAAIADFNAHEGFTYFWYAVVLGDTADGPHDVAWKPGITEGPWRKRLVDE